MTAPLYDLVHDLALEIANASTTNNEQAGLEAYDALQELCLSQEGSDLDHPLQWEALGDFSDNHEDALQAYQKGLVCSSKLGLLEYTASIKFAMAESYFEHNDISKAQQLASEANTEAACIDDNELKMAINEFINEVSHT